MRPPPPSSPYQTNAAVALWVRPPVQRHALGKSVTLSREQGEILDRQLTAAQDKVYTVAMVFYALSIAGAGLGAYHGYKRNDSVGWGVGWGVLGAMFPIFVVPIAMAQGFGKRKK